MYPGERLNSYTHLAGSVLALAGGVTLVSMAAARHDPWRLASFSIYGLTLFLTYVSSTFYHGTRGRTKEIFRRLDHISIYLMIAGTYTPFAMVALHGTWGWRLLEAAWGLALLGIVQEVLVARGARITSLVIYLVMGWMGLVFGELIADALSMEGFLYLLGGGIVYTVGIVFYLFDERFPHWHGIWHLFVIAGSVVHYAAILKFMA
ncbi:MAG TPA: hemolysin III family protein [Usitatibacter sp.]|jgi:hemolysin III|nr:hemolysin III family protein [Usitatibacter sp.]